MTELEALETQKASLKDKLEKREMVNRLYKNHDFRKLILEEFCTNEAARYVQASVDTDLKQEARDNSLAIAQSTGHLRRWLHVQKVFGDQAEEQIRQIDFEAEQLRAEEAAEEGGN